MWPIKTILFALLYAALCLGSLMDPSFGVLNYVLVYQVDPQSAWWGIPLRDMGIRFSMYAAACMMVGMLVGRRTPPRAAPSGRLWELGVFLLVLIGFLSIFTGVGYTGESAARLDKFWKMLLFVLVMGRLLTTRETLRRFLWTIVIGTLYLGREAFIAGPSRFHLGRLNDIGGPDFQFSSGFAVHLGAVLPLVGAALLIAKSWYGRILALAAGAFGFNAMILCRTRSAIVGLAAGAAMAALMAPKQRRYRILVLLVICGAIATTLMDPGFWQRMMTITDPETRATDTAIVTRLDVWQVGVKMIRDYPLGVGAGNFEQMTRAYYHERRAAHNTFLNCIAELGIPAGLIFLTMLTGSFLRLHRAMREAEAIPGFLEIRYMGYGVFVSLVTYVVAGFFTERFYTESFWWVLTLPLCIQRTIENELAEAQLAAMPMPPPELEHASPLIGRPAYV